MSDMLYPRNCLQCGVSSPEPFRHICWDCFSDTPKIEAPFCALCGDPVAGSIQHDYICFACAREKPAFERARSAVRYEGAVGNAVRDLKYKHALWLVRDMAELLFNCLQAEYPEILFDQITAVPLHPPRRRERGFNQSAVLGAALARRLELPFSERLLRRVRPTVSQTGLTAPQRAANVCGAFRVGWFARPAGRRILLVDDVMTTGATVNACAKTLKQAGAVSVHVITVARG
ncbi:MAG: ComF family protein [Kiritimatiellales bacterium]|nr:ComF family protein [Kiritimatiellales bacterium]